MKKNDRSSVAVESESNCLSSQRQEVRVRLSSYKNANATDFAYYTRVVREAPARAVDMLLYKDMLRHEIDMREIEKQMPAAKAFYDAQKPELKARIDGRLESIHPYYRNRAFVHEVLREINRISRRASTA
jgi:hypothetical protein